MIRTARKLFSSISSTGISEPQRCIWGWLNTVCNQVDEDRIKTVGPNRACAEWLLRCGASVRWKNCNYFEKDYNLLPPGEFKKYEIEEIDASDSSVMVNGFPHLRDLCEVKKIILHNCGYLDDSALEYLGLVKDTLQHLQLSSCGDITERGLVHLMELSELKELVMFDLPEIRDKESSVKMLKSALTSCEVKYLEAQKE